MNQEWNKGLSLDSAVLEKTKKMKPIDLMVGVLCKDVETTVLNVLNVINEGLYRNFPEYNMAIVISKADSADSTDDAISLFQPYKNIHCIVANDITNGGKGAGVMTIFEIAHEVEAKCVVLMDGDLLSIKPGWIQTIANPVVYGRADLTVPYYIRDKNDGVITNNLVYPFTRTLYGIDIRQPIAGEFALSRNLYEALREHPLFPPDFGIDIFIVTSAAAEGFYVKEGLFSLKIHESTTHYLEPEKFLIPMFRKVTRSMFELARYYQDYWSKRPSRWASKYHRVSFSQKPIPVQINIDDMDRSFRNDYVSVKESMHNFIPSEIAYEIDGIVNNDNDFNAELWAKIVFHYASAYKNSHDESKIYTLLDSLKTLWIGRFVSYARQVEQMDVNESEKIIQAQAEIFEKEFEYLKNIY
ncbi:glycosyl transferase family 2 [Thermoplasmatales archaeon ex4572_165]|nr:MAG: glycosyl transferase family 2 [Thermoplasmatales archaeon ex4572_165]RLF59001.1 MAG: glycosyl transferase family 2 [Thermoplasmata archaeon]